MRIIKMTPNDPEIDTPEKARRFLREGIHKEPYVGKFHIPRGRVAENGLAPGEPLVFTYSGRLLYLGNAATGREPTEPEDRWHRQYPYYFMVDLQSLVPAAGTMLDLERVLHDERITDKSIAQSQGWPSVLDTPKLLQILERFKQ